MMKTSFTIAGVVVVVLHVIGTIAPSSWNWGFHSFGFLPVYISVPVIILMAILLLPAVQQAVLRGIEKISARVIASPPLLNYVWYITTLVLTACLFWYAKTETSLLGDGSMVLRTLPTFPGTQFIPKTAFHNEPFVSFLLIHVDKICSALNLEPSHELAYRIVGIVSGLLAISVLVFFTRKLFREAVDRALFVLFILSAGGSALFFGYIENYSPTYTVVLLYCITGAAFLRKELHPFIPSIAFGILFSCHFGMVVFFPSLMFLLYRAWKSRGFLVAVGSVAATTVTAGFLLWISGYTPDSFLEVFLRSEKHLLPVAGPVGDYQAYTLFSWAHFLDIANLLLLISPFAVVIILAGVVVLRKNVLKDETWQFLLLITCCTLGFIALVNATLGMSRDWDLLAPFVAGVMVAAGTFLVALVDHFPGLRRIMAGLTMITLCSSAGWVAVNAGEENALTRFERLQDGKFWGRIAMTSAFEELSVHYRLVNNVPKTMEYIDKFIALDSLNPRMWAGRGMAQFRFEGNSPNTIRSFERAVALGSKEWGVFLNLGVGYGEQEKFADAMKMFMSAKELNPNSEIILNNIGITHIKLDASYDKALPYFLDAISRNSRYAPPYQNASLCYVNMKEYDAARSYLERYRQLVPNDPESDIIMKAIQSAKN